MKHSSSAAIFDKRYVYMCDTCREGFTSNVSTEEEPDAEVLCSHCQSVFTRFISEPVDDANPIAEDKIKLKR